MGTRLELHEELMEFQLDLYFQPPQNIQLSYPCIVYSKTGKNKSFGNNGVYFSKQGYQIMLIEQDPDSPIADAIETHFDYCSIDQHYAADNLNHTTLTLYY